jgi:electron-transferring-flavoprotein dehydrogenase
MRPLKPGWTEPERIKFDDRLTFSKLSDVYLSGTTHEEDQPCHLHVLEPSICTDRCAKEFGNPCRHFCPAAVYEWVKKDTADAGRLQINFSNCVHCKTCDIMDPYGIIRWVPPEGGGGPSYQNL